MTRAAAALLLVLLAGCGERAAAPDPAPREPAPGPAKPRIYSSLPQAGELRDVHLAAQLAFEQHGAGFEHVALESSRPDIGLHWEVGEIQANARRAAADPRAVAYVGEIASGASATSMPILGQAGIAQVAPGGTYTGLTRAEGAESREPGAYRGDHGPHLVRVIPADHLQAAAAVKWMHALGTRRLLTVGDREHYGDGLARMVARRARAAGIDASEATFRPHRLATIREVAERAKALGVDTVYFGGIWQNRAIALWGRLHRALPAARLMGSDGLADRPFYSAILRSSRPLTFITSPDAPPPRGFARAFRERYGHAPHPRAVYGHRAMRRALRAAGEAGGRRRGVVNALFAQPGVDAYGDMTRGRFAGHRVTRDGRLRLERVLVVSQ